MVNNSLSILVILATVAATSPALAQGNGASSATSCSSEAQRLAEGFSLNSPSASGGPASQQPGNRVDASMDAESQREARDLTQQARSAAQRGDAAGCMQSLNRARGLLRQSGVGPRPAGEANAAADPAGTPEPASRGITGNRAEDPSAADLQRQNIERQGAETPATAAPPRTGANEGSGVTPRGAPQNRNSGSGSPAGGAGTGPGNAGSPGGTPGGSPGRSSGGASGSGGGR